MSAISRFLLFVFPAVLAAACSSDVAPVEKAAKPDSTKKAVELSPEEARLSSLDAKYRKIESLAQTHPRDREFILSQIDDFQKDAAGTEYAQKAGKLAGDVRTKFDADARATYEKIAAEAKKLVTERKLRAAQELLGEYPEEFSATEWRAKIDKMLEPLEAEISAEDRLVETLAEVAGLKDMSPEAAMRKLNEYPEYLRKGKRKEEWEKAHSELAAKVKVIEEQRRKEAALPWEDLYTGKTMDKWSKGAGEWAVSDGCIVGKFRGAPDSAGQICCGSENSQWDDIIVEVEFKVVSGDYFVLGTRGKNVPGQGSTFAQIDLGPRYLPAGKFHDVSVEIRGGVYTVRDTIGRVIITENMDEGFTKGFICFYISNGGEVHIRKVRLKHLK